MKQPQQEDDSIPVIKTQTDTQRSAQTTENVTEVSQMTEETHRQAGNQEEENPIISGRPGESEQVPEFSG